MGKQYQDSKFIVYRMENCKFVQQYSIEDNTPEAQQLQEILNRIDRKDQEDVETV